MDPKNIRPISLIPIVSKIIEKVGNTWSNYGLNGFNKDHSTDTSLLYVTGKILTCFDSCLPSRMVFIDLQKAFDTINHEILPRKMSPLGFVN